LMFKQHCLALEIGLRTSMAGTSIAALKTDAVSTKRTQVIRKNILLTKTLYS